MSVSILGLVAIRDARDIETRLNEVEKLLKAIVSMPCKVSMTYGAGGGWGGGQDTSCLLPDNRCPHPHSWLLPPWMVQATGRGRQNQGKGRLLWARAAPLFSPW